MKICPKCGFSMLYYKDNKSSYWKCTNCGHCLEEQKKQNSSLCNSISNLIIAVIMILMCILCFHLNGKVQTLTKKNDTLTENLHFLQYQGSELYPCPLCNHEAELYDLGSVSKKYYIRCTKCGYETYAYDTVQKTIDVWNKNISRQN